MHADRWGCKAGAEQAVPTGRVCTVNIASHGQYHVTSLYPTVGIRETDCRDETALTSELTQTPEPRIVATEFLEDLSLDFLHRWEQRLSLVPNLDVEPTCMLASDSMAMNCVMLHAGDSMAMNCLMLITSDLCRQVMQYPTMTVCDACASRLVWEHEPQQPTSDKGPWPKWLNELVMHN
eukprot:1281952-Amphidinium_carterae.1